MASSIRLTSSKVVLLLIVAAVVKKVFSLAKTSYFLRSRDRECKEVAHVRTPTVLLQVPISQFITRLFPILT